MMWIKMPGLVGQTSGQVRWHSTSFGNDRQTCRTGHKVLESRMEPSPCGGWIYALRNELDMGAGKGGGKVQSVWDGDRVT